MTLTRKLTAPEIVTGWIQGEPVPLSADVRYMPIINPATGQAVGKLAMSDPNEVDAAIQAARKVYNSGDWRKTSIERRQAVMLKMSDLILEYASELAQLELLHTGLPITHLRSFHVPRCAYNFRFFAEYIGQTSGQTYDQMQGFMTRVSREPIGVAALIGPSNMPLGLSLMKVAACVAFGNSCVLKPSELTPLSFPLIMHLFNEAGFPRGVINLINGTGEITGKSLIEHPDINAISFTGGTETGQRIGEIAGRRFLPHTMELGGKSANIIFDDADIDAAVDGAVLSSFANNGQQCLAGARILVQEGIAERFIEKFVLAAQKLKIGNPGEADTDIGPVQSESHMNYVLSFVTTAQNEGGKILTGGKRPVGLNQGYYIEPTIAEVPNNSIKICQQEIFGPFVTVQRFKTVDEAIVISNESEYGLVAYVWTRDIGRAQHVTKSIDTGVVWVNTSVRRELRAPFGGNKLSGIGSEGGKACERLYTKEKTITYKEINPL